MKILVADFEIAKYGGIVEHVESKVKAFKALGHEVDIIQFAPSGISEANYKKKVSEFETGKFHDKIVFNSQGGGYEKSEATGYWKNNYYGYFLPPSNKICVFDSNSIKYWKQITEDVDLIIWNFTPTKSSVWGTDFNFWWKYYDLPSTIKQVFIVHDAYFDVRASHVSALKDKITYLECAHIAAYECCKNIGMKRALLLNPRYLEDDIEMPVIKLEDREIDFFAAHVFKSMKHVDDLIRSVPYLNNEYSVVIAGSGIEQAYMVAKEKIKDTYVCSVKRDPDLPKKLDKKISIWDRAEKWGMSYIGQISGKEVESCLLNSKFAVDPSWCKHYAQYCNTHINGFIIEAMLNGCYPVLRDYRGCSKVYPNEDLLFDNIKAIYIPWDSTPKEFAIALKEASENISPKQYLKDTKHNFEIVRELFNAKKNAEETIRLITMSDKKLSKELEEGIDSDNVKKITVDIMENFYGIKLPIKWRTN